MKFSEINNRCKQNNKKLIELEHNECNSAGYQIKDIYDFLNICGDLIGYECKKMTSDDATQAVVETVLDDYGDLYDHYDELMDILRTSEAEAIVLVDLKNDYVWMQVPSPSKKQFETASRKISRWLEELSDYEENEEPAEETDINEVIDRYKALYRDEHYKKDRDFIVDSLVYNLQTEYGIDTDTNPKYTREKIIKYLSGK